MYDQLKRLIELQQIDSKMFAISRIIHEFHSKIAEAELPLKEFQAFLLNNKQNRDSLEKKKRDKESRLDEISEKIVKVKARTSEIKTNKEYQALLKEIDSLEKDRSSVEDEILAVMEEIDAASKQSKSEETRFTAGKDKIETSKRILEDEKAEAEKELLSIKETRSTLANAIDREIYDTYAILSEACGGIAVTEAKEEICHGCNMNIPPQLFVEMKKNEDIFYCPQCRIIIYFKNDS
jgi:predicted  nucleic acid-binding Zn-ribbon protein